MNQPAPSAKPPARPLSRVVLAAMLCWAMLFLLLWVEDRLGVLHPSALLLLALFLTAVVLSLVALARCCRRVIRGPRRGGALAWSVAALTPVGLVVCWLKYILD